MTYEELDIIRAQIAQAEQDLAKAKDMVARMKAAGMNVVEEEARIAKEGARILRYKKAFG